MTSRVGSRGTGNSVVILKLVAITCIRAYRFFSTFSSTSFPSFVLSAWYVGYNYMCKGSPNGGN
jgi:hypothetical protein